MLAQYIKAHDLIRIAHGKEARMQEMNEVEEASSNGTNVMLKINQQVHTPVRDLLANFLERFHQHLL